MSKSIEVQLDKILKEYLEEADDDAETVFKEVGKDTSKDLKATAGNMFKKVGSGKHYADGWTYKVSGWGLNANLTVYNKTKPGLAHLLENGHDVVVNGKSTGKRAGAHKHIEPAQEKATEELLNKLRGKL